jgi:hypothetical protein
MMMRTLRREDSRLSKTASDVCFLCAMSLHKLISSPELGVHKAAHKDAMHTHLKAKDAHIQVHHAYNYKNMAIQHELYATGLRTPLDRPHRAAAKKHREKTENHLV